MLARLHELAAARTTFAFETTLASRSFAPWIRRLVDEGYEFHLVFFWLPSADVAIQRVASRVRAGGHNVPAETIRRRYTAGIANFFGLYAPLATSWRLLDNTLGGASLIASGQGGDAVRVLNQTTWSLFEESGR